MQNKSSSTAERLLLFAASCINLGGRMSRTMAGLYIASQLMRSAGSSGANYEEACGAESRADFVHKMQLVLKELRESGYWLRLCATAKLVPSNDLTTLLREADELTRIIAKSVMTAKSRGISL